MPLDIILTSKTTAYAASPAILWSPLQRGLLTLAVCCLVALGIGLVLVLLDEVWRNNAR